MPLYIILYYIIIYYIILLLLFSFIQIFFSFPFLHKNTKAQIIYIPSTNVLLRENTKTQSSFKVFFPKGSMNLGQNLACLPSPPYSSGTTKFFGE